MWPLVRYRDRGTHKLLNIFMVLFYQDQREFLMYSVLMVICLQRPAILQKHLGKKGSTFIFYEKGQLIDNGATL